MKEHVRKRVTEMQRRHDMRVGLSIVRVGNSAASQIYVSSKKKQCQEVGIRSFEHHFPEHATQEAIMAQVQSLNDDPEVHGIIVQLPLPAHMNTQEVIQSVAVEKDVDGLHPNNLGLLFSGVPRFVPCTPLGCLELIRSVEEDIAGLHAVVIGASNLVGKPMAQLLLNEKCTVTVLHSRSRNCAAVARQADILVAAAGAAHLVGADWVKPGAIVIDVGINRIMDQDGATDIIGDVDFEQVKGHVKAITPVPGGVGPMTVVSLLLNTLRAAELSLKLG